MPQDNLGPGNREEAGRTRDAQGQAALILVESLIHGLIERSVLSTSASIQIIDSAIEVQAEVARSVDDPTGEMWRSHAILTSMAASLSHDIDTVTVDQAK